MDKKRSVCVCVCCESVCMCCIFRVLEEEKEREREREREGVRQDKTAGMVHVLGKEPAPSQKRTSSLIKRVCFGLYFVAFPFLTSNQGQQQDRKSVV